MDCTYCPGNKATFHLSKLVNGKSVEVHICEKCLKEINQEIDQDNIIDYDMWDAVAKLAIKKGKQDPCKLIEEEALQISAKSLLIPSSDIKESNDTCSKCGFTNEDLRKTGRLGCAHCYEVFNDMLQDVFNDCQKGIKHHGKIPSSFESLKIDKLQNDLRQAISEERFEDAANLRDQLQRLQKAS